MSIRISREDSDEYPCYILQKIDPRELTVFKFLLENMRNARSFPGASPPGPAPCPGPTEKLTATTRPKAGKGSQCPFTKVIAVGTILIPHKNFPHPTNIFKLHQKKLFPHQIFKSPGVCWMGQLQTLIFT